MTDVAADSVRLPARFEEIYGIATSPFGGFASHEIVYNEEGQPIDYRFLYVNPAFKQILSTALGFDNIDNFDPVNNTATEIYSAPFHLNIFAEVANHNGDNVVLTSDGVEVVIKVERISGVDVRSCQFLAPVPQWGKIYEVKASSVQHGQFVTEFIDVTERENAIAEQRRLQKENDLLMKRIGVIGWIKSMVDHDIRNDLTTNGIKRVILQRSFHEIQQEGEEKKSINVPVVLIKAVNDFLAVEGEITRTQQFSSELEESILEGKNLVISFSCNNLFRDVFKSRQKKAESVGVSLSIPEQSPEEENYIYSNNLLLYFALRELINNSIKYRNPDAVGGCQTQLGVETLSDGRRCLFCRSNSFPIEFENVQRIFEPQVRLRPQVAQGTGMGLYYLKSMIEDILHPPVDGQENSGGKVELVIDEDGWNRFNIIIPKLI